MGGVDGRPEEAAELPEQGVEIQLGGGQALGRGQTRREGTAVAREHGARFGARETEAEADEEEPRREREPRRAR